MDINLNIKERKADGKRAARKLRHESMVPGVVYGSGTEPMAVSINTKALEQLCYSSSFFSHVIDVNLAGKAEKILPRSVDYHPVTDKPIHVDFQRVSRDSKIKVHISIEFVDEEKSPGMKKGGVLNIVVHQLECLCSANSIPEKFVLSLSGKEIGDSFLLENMDLPKGIEPSNPERDAVIATLVGSRTASSEDEIETTEMTEETATAE